MSGLPNINDATKKVSIKRKGAPVSPLATRRMLDEAIACLIEGGTVREISPRNTLSIHPSTKASGSGFQHERRVWGLNERDL